MKSEEMTETQTHAANLAGAGNLAGAFFDRLKAAPQSPLLAKRSGETWQVMTTAEVAAAVERLAAGLIGLGIEAGDRVLIASENRPEWAIADLAIMAIGAIVVPAYITNTIEDHVYIMEHSGACLAITSGASLGRGVIAAAAQSGVKTVITMEGIEAEDDEDDRVKTLLWDDVLGSEIVGDNIPGDDLASRVAALNPDDTCCLIYTSGTGGRPKGVMLTHRSIQANIDAAVDLLIEGGVAHGQRFLSLLPLSHSYEHTAGLHLPIQMGSEIYYSEGADKVANELAEVRPTLMIAVPRLYEVLYDRITRGVKAKGGVSAWLFGHAVRLGHKQLIGRLNPVEKAANRILDLLVRRKVNGRFGGRLKYFISGGAALNPDIGNFFLGLGVHILQGYGQTEASPLISVNRPDKIKIATVGPAVKGVEVKISPDDEILARGDMLMKGYWHDDAATRAVLIDGWLHTGDLGSVDEDGYITITGRAKDIIVNSGGDNIAPVRVEAALGMQPEIEQAMVYGDRKPWLSAVIVPSAEVMAHEADDAGVLAALNEAVGRANRSLGRFERVRRIIRADEPFSVANSQMTATLKPRRHIITEVYRSRLEGLYKT